MMERKFAKFFHSLVHELIPDHGHRDQLFDSLRRYQSSQKLHHLLGELRQMLDEPDKLELFEYIRPLILLRHQMEYSYLAPAVPGVRLRTVRLLRTPGQSLGFAVRGGYEFNVGVFVSSVESGSQAERQGLKVGDEIVRVNGFTIAEAIHDDVLSLIKSRDEIMLKVTHIGMLPVKDHASDTVTWRYVEEMDSKKALDEVLAEKQVRRGKGVELKIFIDCTGYDSIGCGILSGPPYYPGIFVEKVRPGSLAQEVGLEVGDQILEVNDSSFLSIGHNEAVVVLRASKQLNVIVRKHAGLPLFERRQLSSKVSSSAINSSQSPSNHSPPISQRSGLSSSSWTESTVLDEGQLIAEQLSRNSLFQKRLSATNSSPPGDSSPPQQSTENRISTQAEIHSDSDSYHGSVGEVTALTSEELTSADNPVSQLASSSFFTPRPLPASLTLPDHLDGPEPTSDTSLSLPTYTSANVLLPLPEDLGDPVMAALRHRAYSPDSPPWVVPHAHINISSIDLNQEGNSLDDDSSGFQPDPPDQVHVDTDDLKLIDMKDLKQVDTKDWKQVNTDDPKCIDSDAEKCIDTDDQRHIKMDCEQHIVVSCEQQIDTDNSNDTPSLFADSSPCEAGDVDMKKLLQLEAGQQDNRQMAAADFIEETVRKPDHMEEEKVRKYNSTEDEKVSTSDFMEDEKVQKSEGEDESIEALVDENSNFVKGEGKSLAPEPEVNPGQANVVSDEKTENRDDALGRWSIPPVFVPPPPPASSPPPFHPSHANDPSLAGSKRLSPTPSRMSSTSTQTLLKGQEQIASDDEFEGVMEFGDDDDDDDYSLSAEAHGPPDMLGEAVSGVDGQQEDHSEIVGMLSVSEDPHDDDNDCSTRVKQSPLYETGIDISGDILAESMPRMSLTMEHSLVGREDGQDLEVCGLAVAKTEVSVEIHQSDSPELAAPGVVVDDFPPPPPSSFEDVETGEDTLSASPDPLVHAVMVTEVTVPSSQNHSPLPIQPLEPSAPPLAFCPSPPQSAPALGVMGGAAAVMAARREAQAEEWLPRLLGPAEPGLSGVGSQSQHVLLATWFNSFELDGRELKTFTFARGQRLGIELEGGMGTPLAGRIVVAAVFDGGAAVDQGLQTGDQLMMVNNHKLTDITVAQAEQILEDAYSGPNDVIQVVYTQSNFLNDEECVTYF